MPIAIFWLTDTIESSRFLRNSWVNAAAAITVPGSIRLLCLCWLPALKKTKGNVTFISSVRKHYAIKKNQNVYMTCEIFLNALPMLKRGESLELKSHLIYSYNWLKEKKKKNFLPHFLLKESYVMIIIIKLCQLERKSNELITVHPLLNVLFFSKTLLGFGFGTIKPNQNWAKRNCMLKSDNKLIQLCLIFFYISLTSHFYSIWAQ